MLDYVTGPAWDTADGAMEASIFIGRQMIAARRIASGVHDESSKEEIEEMRRQSVVAYVQTRLTNGVVEGLNNKTRMVTRRAFGFHSASALIAMIHLVCGGIELDPPLP